MNGQLRPRDVARFLTNPGTFRRVRTLAGAASIAAMVQWRDCGTRDADRGFFSLVARQRWRSGATKAPPRKLNKPPWQIFALNACGPTWDGKGLSTIKVV